MHTETPSRYRVVCAVLTSFVLGACAFAAPDTTGSGVLHEFESARVSVLDADAGGIVPLPAGLREAKTMEALLAGLSKVGDILYDDDEGGAFIVTSGRGAIVPARDKQRLGQTAISSLLTDLSEGILRPIVVGDYAVIGTRTGQGTLLHIDGLADGTARLTWLRVADIAKPIPAADMEAFDVCVEKATPAPLAAVPTTGLATITAVSGDKPVGFSFATGATVPLPAPPLTSAGLAVLKGEYWWELRSKGIDLVYDVFQGYPVLRFPGYTCGHLGKGNLDELSDQSLLPSLRRSKGFAGAQVEPFNIFTLRSLSGEYAVMRVESRDDGSMTFRWVRQPDGSASFRDIKVGLGEKRYVTVEEQAPLNEQLIELACESGNMAPDEVKREFERLVNAGAEPNAESRLGHVLLVAAEHGTLDMVRLLVDARAEVTASGALFGAVLRGDPSMCRYLIESGADVHAPPLYDGGPTVLEAALRPRSRSDEVLALLKQHGATNTLRAAAEADDVEAIRRLVAEGADVNKAGIHGETPLHAAAMFGAAEACRALIELGADPSRTNGKGCSPAESAAGRKHWEAAEVLIAHSPPKARARALQTAAAFGNTELAARGAALDGAPGELFAGNMEQWNTMLTCAQPDAVSAFEKNGLELPLWAAARYGRVDRIRKLLADGVDVDEPCPLGHRHETPLLFAAGMDQVEAARILIDHGAEVNVTSRRRSERAPLHEAAEHSSADFIRLLLKHGAKVDPELSIDGHTPLVLAVRLRRPPDAEVVKALLEGGADPNVKVYANDETGKKVRVPLWQAAPTEEIADLLKAHR